MTKKQLESKKKTASTGKKAPAANKKAANTNGQTASASNRGTNAKKLLPSGAVDEYRVDLIPLGDLEKVKEDVQSAMDLFTELADNNLTPIQRRRKIGAGIRNYGFIEKVADLAEANPQYAQFFDPNDLRNAIMNFDLCRNLLVMLQSFIRSVSNTALIYSNDAYGMSLIFYNIVRDMGRRDSCYFSFVISLSIFFNTVQEGE